MDTRTTHGELVSVLELRIKANNVYISIIGTHVWQLNKHLR